MTNHTVQQTDDSLLEFDKRVRDPLYDYIYLTRLEVALIDTPAFQRLDRIGQMHSVHKVFPSANYSRKVHSLGAMHLAGRAMQSLIYGQDPRVREVLPSTMYGTRNTRERYVQTDENDEIDNISYLRYIARRFRMSGGEFVDELRQGFDVIEEMNDSDIDIDDNDDDNEMDILRDAQWLIQSARLLGLLHDCGHGPFSHMLEHVDGVDFHHEEMAPGVIECIKEQAIERSDIYDLHIDRHIQFVIYLIESDKGDLGKLRFLKELVDFPFDCDMLDYIVRDAYAAGTLEYGQTDVDRIIKGLVVNTENGQLAITRRNLADVGNVLESLFSMYKVVYSYKTARMYNVILNKSFQEFGQLISDITSDVSEFVKYDDERFICELRNQLPDHIDPDAPGERVGFDDEADSLEASWWWFKQFQDREKPYEQRLYKPLVLDIDRLNPEEPLERPTQLIEEKEQRIRDEIDSSPDIDIMETQLQYDSPSQLRRGGVNIEELSTWIRNEVVYDTNQPDRNRVFRTLYELDPELGTRLPKIEIPIRVFVDRELPGDTKDRIQEIAERELHTLNADMSAAV